MTVSIIVIIDITKLLLPLVLLRSGLLRALARLLRHLQVRGARHLRPGRRRPRRLQELAAVHLLGGSTCIALLVVCFMCASSCQG